MPAKASLIWTNSGAAGSYEVGIRGYLAFTTGTYSIAVTPLDVVYDDIPRGVDDTDHDGLPDPWEWYYFGELTNAPSGDWDGDGLSNLAEFYARTLPRDPTSTLLLHSRVSTPGVAAVDWPAVPDSVYRVWRSTNLVAGSWIPLDPLYHPAGGGTNQQWNEDINASQQFYKVELFIAP